LAAPVIEYKSSVEYLALFCIVVLYLSYISSNPFCFSNLSNQYMWHSGLSPHPYELVILPNNVKVCYGCGSPFTPEYRYTPKNVVIRHKDRRFIRRGENSQPVYSVDFQNTYYHLDVNHIDTAEKSIFQWKCDGFYNPIPIVWFGSN